MSSEDTSYKVFDVASQGGADPVSKYVNQLSKQPEYRRVTFVRFDMDKLGVRFPVPSERCCFT